MLTPYPVSREACEQMIATCKFITPYSPDGHPLILCHPNHFEESQVGSIWYGGGKVLCRGQNLEVDGKVYYDTVNMAAYQVNINNNRLFARGDRIESPDPTFVKLRVKITCENILNLNEVWPY